MFGFVFTENYDYLIPDAIKAIAPNSYPRGLLDRGLLDDGVVEVEKPDYPSYMMNSFPYPPLGEGNLHLMVTGHKFENLHQMEVAEIAKFAELSLAFLNTTPNHAFIGFNEVAINEVGPRISNISGQEVKCSNFRSMKVEHWHCLAVPDKSKYTIKPEDQPETFGPVVKVFKKIYQEYWTSIPSNHPLKLGSVLIEGFTNPFDTNKNDLPVGGVVTEIALEDATDLVASSLKIADHVKLIDAMIYEVTEMLMIAVATNYPQVKANGYYNPDNNFAIDFIREYDLVRSNKPDFVTEETFKQFHTAIISNPDLEHFRSPTYAGAFEKTQKGIALGFSQQFFMDQEVARKEGIKKVEVCSCFPTKEGVFIRRNSMETPKNMKHKDDSRYVSGLDAIKRISKIISLNQVQLEKMGDL